MATTVEFFECTKCKALYLSPSNNLDADFLCDQCMEKSARQVKEQFIITCPKCKKYWPRYVIRAITLSGICSCPNQGCGEILKIRGIRLIDNKPTHVKSEINLENQSKGTSDLNVNQISNTTESKEFMLSEEKDKSNSISSEILEAGGDDEPFSEPNMSILEEKGEEQISSEVTKPDEFLAETEMNSVEEKLNVSNEQQQITEIPIRNESIVELEKLSEENKGVVNEIPSIPILGESISESSSGPAEINEIIDENSQILEPMKKEIDVNNSPDLPDIIDVDQYPNILDNNKIDELYRMLIADIKTADTIQPPEFHSIIKSMIATLNKNKSALIEEPIQFAFYIGNLHGDLEQTQRIIRYLDAIVETYPSMKAVFLGNYINYNILDFPTLALLYIFYLKYPQNIILLRGTEEIKEKAEFEGFWTRFSSFFQRKSITMDMIIPIYQDLIISFGLLPLMHIGSMNQGQVRIFSAPSGIPINHEDPAKPFDLKSQLNEISLKINHSADFPLIGQDLMWGLPDETLQEPISFDPESGRLHFSAGIYSNFLKSNKLHYMMRATDRYPEGIKYYFNYMICSVFSANLISAPKSENFSGKIVRLTLGQPPNVINTKPAELLKDLEKTFGITDIDL